MGYEDGQSSRPHRASADPTTPTTPPVPIEGGQGIHGVVLGRRDHLVPDHQGLAVHRPVQLGMPRPLPTETSAGRHRTARFGDGWSTNRPDRPRPEETRQAGGCSSGPPGVRRPTTHHAHQHQRTSERRCPTHSTSASSIVSVDGPALPGLACRIRNGVSVSTGRTSPRRRTAWRYQGTDHAYGSEGWGFESLRARPPDPLHRSSFSCFG